MTQNKVTVRIGMAFLLAITPLTACKKSSDGKQASVQNTVASQDPRLLLKCQLAVKSSDIRLYDPSQNETSTGSRIAFFRIDSPKGELSVWDSDEQKFISKCEDSEICKLTTDDKQFSFEKHHVAADAQSNYQEIIFFDRESGQFRGTFNIEVRSNFKLISRRKIVSNGQCEKSDISQLPKKQQKKF